MNQRVGFIEHKGKEIFFIDYSNLQGQEYLDFSLSIADIALSSGKTNQLLLIDFTGSLITREVSAAHKELTRKTHHLYKHLAFVGMDPLRRILANAALSFVTNKVRLFKTLEEAKDWLVEVSK